MTSILLLLRVVVKIFLLIAGHADLYCNLNSQAVIHTSFPVTFQNRKEFPLL